MSGMSEEDKIAYLALLDQIDALMDATPNSLAGDILDALVDIAKNYEKELDEAPKI